MRCDLHQDSILKSSPETMSCRVQFARNINPFRAGQVRKHDRGTSRIHEETLIGPSMEKSHFSCFAFRRADCLGIGKNGLLVDGRVGLGHIICEIAQQRRRREKAVAKGMIYCE